MTLQEVMTALEAMGSESTKKIFINHGAQGDLYGVKVGDMKTLVKKIKKDYQLSLELYNTGNSDAMYLAGLIADDMQMSKDDLQNWAEKATWSMISEYTVPWVASQGKHGYGMALKWIESDKDSISSAGWSTLSCLMALKPDHELDLDNLKSLLDRASKSVHSAGNRTRYCMNGFIISVGSYISSLSDYAENLAAKMGKVEVFQGNTACKVPVALDYIQKVKLTGGMAKKKKTVKC